MKIYETPQNKQIVRLELGTPVGQFVDIIMHKELARVIRDSISENISDLTIAKKVN